MFSWRNKKNIMWIPSLICSYGPYDAPAYQSSLDQNAFFQRIWNMIPSSVSLIRYNLMIWALCLSPDALLSYSTVSFIRCTVYLELCVLNQTTIKQGPVVQSVVSLTSSLRVISLTVLADSIYNILIFFAEKMWVAFALQKLLTFFQQKISAYLRITRCKF